MPDTGVAGAAGEPYDHSMESRVSRPEQDMGQVKGSLIRIETAMKELRDEIAQMRADHAQMHADHAEIRADHAQMRIEAAEMRGLVRNLPTTWAMLTGIIGGQIAFVGVLVAAAHLFPRF